MPIQQRPIGVPGSLPGVPPPGFRQAPLFFAHVFRSLRPHSQKLSEIPIVTERRKIVLIVDDESSRERVHRQTDRRRTSGKADPLSSRFTVQGLTMIRHASMLRESNLARRLLHGSSPTSCIASLSVCPYILPSSNESMT